MINWINYLFLSGNNLTSNSNDDAEKFVDEILLFLFVWCSSSSSSLCSFFSLFFKDESDETIIDGDASIDESAGGGDSMVLSEHSGDFDEDGCSCLLSP